MSKMNRFISSLIIGREDSVIKINNNYYYLTDYLKLLPINAKNYIETYFYNYINKTLKYQLKKTFEMLKENKHIYEEIENIIKLKNKE